jgi:hypothetical protein
MTISMRRLATIAIGIAAAQTAAAAVFRQRRRRYAGARRHLLVVQGGMELRLSADEIEDLVVSVMMGGMLLDLRAANLTRRPAHIDVTAVMGGVMLVVPDGWKVRLEGEALMGGVRYATKPSADVDQEPDLVVFARVVMGGLDVTDRMPGEKGDRGDRSEVGSQKLEKKLEAGNQKSEARKHSPAGALTPRSSRRRETASES